MSDHPARRRFWIAAGALLAIGVLSSTLPWAAWIQAFLHLVESLGAWGPVLFVGAFVVLTVLFVPGVFLSVGAGIAWRVPTASVLVFVGATAGAAAAFLVARTVMRQTVRTWVERHPRLLAVDHEIDRRGWIVSVLVRLSPILPYSVMNYVLGVTSLSLRAMLLGCFAMIPGIVLYAGIGAALGEAAVGRDRPRTTAEWAFLAVGLAATLTVTTWLGRVAARPPRTGPRTNADID